MKKNLFLLVAIMTVILTLAGCGSNSAPAPAGTATPAATAAPAANVVLKAGHAGILLNGKHPYQQGLEKFNELVKQKTNGRISIEIFGNGQLGNERDTIEGVSMGTVDVALITNSPITGFVPEYNVLDMPYLFENREQAHKVLDSDVGKELLKKLEAKNIVGLSFMENGVRSITNSKLPIKTPADLAGIKIRVMETPVHIATFKALGANPTPMVWGEVFTGLQQGTIDGQENMMMGIISAKLNEVQKYLSLTEHFYTPAVLMINKDLLQKLSVDDQKAVQEAAAEATIYQREECKSQNDASLKELVNAGMTVNEVDKAPFIKAVQPVYDQFSDKYGEWFDKISKAK